MSFTDRREGNGEAVCTHLLRFLGVALSSGTQCRPIALGLQQSDCGTANSFQVLLVRKAQGDLRLWREIWPVEEMALELC